LESRRCGRQLRRRRLGLQEVGGATAGRAGPTAALPADAYREGQTTVRPPRGPLTAQVYCGNRVDTVGDGTQRFSAKRAAEPGRGERCQPGGLVRRPQFSIAPAVIGRSRTKPGQNSWRGNGLPRAAGGRRGAG
jgi:hypothetical protein